MPTKKEFEQYSKIGETLSICVFEAFKKTDTLDKASSFLAKNHFNDFIKELFYLRLFIVFYVADEIITDRRTLSFIMESFNKRTNNFFNNSQTASIFNYKIKDRDNRTSTYNLIIKDYKSINIDFYNEALEQILDFCHYNIDLTIPAKYKDFKNNYFIPDMNNFKSNVQNILCNMQQNTNIYEKETKKDKKVLPDMSKFLKNLLTVYLIVIACIFTYVPYQQNYYKGGIPGIYYKHSFINALPDNRGFYSIDWQRVLGETVIATSIFGIVYIRNKR